MSLVKELVVKILGVAEERVPEDDEDFSVNDYAGGNMDDAYELGVDAGYARFARELEEIIKEHE